MKVLLDENLPHELRHLITGHEVFTATYMGWSGLRNGVLLAKATQAGFDALITLDSGIEYQQHLPAMDCSVFILHAESNRIRQLVPLVPALLTALNESPPRSLVHVR